MAEFDLRKNTGLFIYGLSDRSTSVIDQLLKEGYFVLGIISDGYPEEMKYGNLSVLSYERFCSSNPSGSNPIILILLKNIFSHCKIARKLLSKGFDHLIFLPDQSFSIDYKRMTNYYNLLLEFSFEEIINVPVASPDTCLDSRWIQDEGGDYLKIWCPPELACTDLEGTKYHQKSIAGLVPYLDFIDYFLYQKQTDLKEYYALQGYSEDTEELLSYQLDRINLIEFYEKQILFEADYFMDSAPIGKWMDQGGFLLSDGHHRQAYLLRKGYSLLPLRISKVDYQNWCNWSKEAVSSSCQRILLPQMSDCFWGSRRLFFSYQGLLERYFREDEKWDILVESEAFGGYFGRRFSDINVKNLIFSSQKELNNLNEVLRSHFQEGKYVIFVIGMKEEQQMRMIIKLFKSYKEQYEIVQIPNFFEPEKE